MLTQGVAQHNLTLAILIKLCHIEHRHSVVECGVNSAYATLLISAGHTTAAQSNSIYIAIEIICFVRSYDSLLS